MHRIARHAAWLTFVIWGVLLRPPSASAFVFSVGPSTPDHSQHSDVTWMNYCGPTTGSDWIYYFASTYPALRQGNPLPPDLGADPGADAVIAELASRMGTTFANGTSAQGLATGIEEYLELHDGDPAVAWATRFHMFQGPAPIGPAELSAFLVDVQGVLQAGGAVVLLLQWPIGAPSSAYDLPENLPDIEDLQNGAVTAAHALGHVVALVGFDDLPAPPALNDFFIHDPANNAGTHLWPGDVGTTQVGPFYDVGKLTFYPEVTISATPAAVVGALLIESQPVPGVPALAPTAAVLLVALLLGAGLVRARQPSRSRCAVRCRPPR